MSGTSAISPENHQPASAAARELARLRAGEAAYRDGDYRLAVQLLLPIAGRGGLGRRSASRYLARMYARGVGGLPKSSATARYWHEVSGQASWRQRLRLLFTRFFPYRHDADPN